MLLGRKTGHMGFSCESCDGPGVVERVEALTGATQYDGQAGVDRMLEIMHDEFRRCMQLTGCKTVKDITKAALGRIDADGFLRRL